MNTENPKDITKLLIYEKYIKSLVGLEGFSDLQELLCYSNPLIVLDTSNNENKCSKYQQFTNRFQNRFTKSV
jgi:hypothetical protein